MAFAALRRTPILYVFMGILIDQGVNSFWQKLSSKREHSPQNCTKSKKITQKSTLSTELSTSCSLPRKVFIHAGVNTGSDTETFLKSHPGFVPHLFEPNPVFHERLQLLARKYNGTLHKKAAWTSSNTRLKFYTNENVFKGGLGGGLFQPQILKSFQKSYPVTKPSSFWVDTVDLSDFVRSEFRMNCDELVLRLDVEGAEYEILRKLLVDGSACFFRRIEYEAHAFFSKANRKFKAFDAVFPWTVSACNTEVELEALHLGGPKLLHARFDLRGLSHCEKCELPPIRGEESLVTSPKPGWWTFTPAREKVENNT